MPSAAIKHNFLTTSIWGAAVVGAVKAFGRIFSAVVAHARVFSAITAGTRVHSSVDADGEIDC